MYRLRASLALPLLVAGCVAAPTGTGGGPGPDTSLAGRRPFPADNPWNTPIDQDPVDPSSDTLIASIGLTRGLHPDFGANSNGGPFGIPYLVVGGSTPLVSVTFAYADENDPGPFPIPANAPIEGGAVPPGNARPVEGGARVILQPLKTYGMIVADNGSDWFISGAPDARWSDDELNTLKQVQGSNFEAVRMGTVVTR